MHCSTVWLRSAVFMTLVSWGSIAVAAGAAAACQAPGGAAEMREQVVAWVNAERQSRGLSALRASGALQNAATMHACAMADARSMVHQVPGGPSFTQRLRKSGYRYRAANENIAMTSSQSVAQVTSMWANSPKHLTNVLDPKVREVGVGIAQIGKQVYWVTNSGAS